MEKPKLRVLSLFDGISAGLVALENLGFELDVYYASEIDKNAINVSRSNFGSKIIQIGSVKDITSTTLDKLGPIHLMIGGSPCEELSLVNHLGRGLYDCEGSGSLFFEFYRILDLFKKKKQPIYWLFENVHHMSIEYRRIISKFLESELYVLDSKKVSPQIRKRIFCSNIPGITDLQVYLNETDDEGPVLDDFLNKNLGRKANITKCNTITTKQTCLQDSKSRDPVHVDGINTSLYITEIEKIFGFPEHYTDVADLSINKRHKLIGKSWCINLIEKILKPLTEFFQMRKI